MLFLCFYFADESHKMLFNQTTSQEVTCLPAIQSAETKAPSAPLTGSAAAECALGESSLRGSLKLVCSQMALAFKKLLPVGKVSGRLIPGTGGDTRGPVAPRHQGSVLRELRVTGGPEAPE